MVRQPFFNFKNRPSHRYDFLKEGSYDVKRDQLICQKPQLHASKIRIPHRSGARYSSSVTLIYVRRYIREAARGENVLPRAAKP
jgi:hypothetical protein